MKKVYKFIGDVLNKISFVLSIASLKILMAAKYFYDKGV